MSCFLINIHRQGTNQIWHVSMSYTKAYPWRWPTLVLKSINYKFYRHRAGLAKFSWQNHGWSDGQILTAVLYISVADPDLQIRGEGAGDDLKKKIFSALRTSLSSKNKGGGAPPPGLSPGSTTASMYLPDAWEIFVQSEFSILNIDIE